MSMEKKHDVSKISEKPSTPKDVSPAEKIAEKYRERKAPKKDAADKKAKPDKELEARKKEQERRFKIGQEFSHKLIAKFKKTVKAVVIYGSTATGKQNKKSDIDVFVIMDDTKVEQEIPPEIKERIWNEMLRIAKETNELITLQAFMFITEFWENLRVAEPVLIAILRNGVPVFDVGVFMPAKRMLLRGKIPTTYEAVEKKITAAPQFVDFAQGRIKSAGHYLEQAMATAGNAALMFMGKMPVNKEDVPQTLQRTFVEQQLLEARYVKEAEEIRVFAKSLEHRKGDDLKSIGAETDKHLKMTDDFVKRMQKLIKELEQRKKSSVIMKTYKTFLKANVGALKYIGVAPPESLKDLPKAIYENFPELKDMHADLFETMTKQITMIKNGKSDSVPERDIYSIQEQTKVFVVQLGKKLKEMKDKGLIKPPKEPAKSAKLAQQTGRTEQKKAQPQDVVTTRVEDFLDGKKTEVKESSEK